MAIISHWRDKIGIFFVMEYCEGRFINEMHTKVL